MAVSLTELKRYLRVVHFDDDELLSSLLASAEAQAMRFLGTDKLEVLPAGVESTSDAYVPADVALAVCLLVRADYEAADPQHAADWRDVAYEKLYSYRQGLGV